MTRPYPITRSLLRKSIPTTGRDNGDELTTQNLSQLTLRYRNLDRCVKLSALRVIRVSYCVIFKRNYQPFVRDPPFLVPRSYPISILRSTVYRIFEPSRRPAFQSHFCRAKPAAFAESTAEFTIVPDKPFFPTYATLYSSRRISHVRAHAPTTFECVFHRVSFLYFSPSFPLSSTYT